MALNIEPAMDRAEVAALDLSAVGTADLKNLKLPRSEDLYDAVPPGRVIQAWGRGDLLAQGHVDLAVGFLTRAAS